MKDTPRTEELREDLAGIPSEAQIWKLFKKMEDMERELAAVTEQRDRLAVALREAMEDYVCGGCVANSTMEKAEQALNTPLDGASC